MRRGIKCILILLFVVLSFITIPPSGVIAGTPHSAYGTIQYSTGGHPSDADLSLNAYIKARPSEILTQTSAGCGYSDGSWWVQCATFTASWQAGDVLHIDFKDAATGAEGFDEVTLTNEAQDDAGETILQVTAESISKPGAPTGETNPVQNVSYTYTTTGATSNQGHTTVEYSFSWGDGATSPWSTSKSAAHSWSTTGSKTVTVTARCQTHTSITNLSDPLTVNVSAATNYIDVTITTEPAGRGVLVDGTRFTAPVTQTWEVNTQHTLSTDQTQSGGSGIQYSFTNWSEGSGRTIVVEATPSKNTFTAYFSTNYYLTTDVSPVAAGTISPASAWYAKGTNVQIEATPATGTTYSFKEWSGNASGNQNPITVNMDAPKSVTANFEDIPPVNIELTTVPLGLNVTVDGTTYISPKQFSWPSGSKHTIGVDKIYPGGDGTRHVFIRWSDNGNLSHEITVPNADAGYQAEFGRECYLTTQNSPSTAGTITRSPDKEWYEEGARVEVTAKAASSSNYSFLNWSGDAAGSSNPVYVYMTDPKHVNANYIQLSGSDVVVRFPSDLHGAPGDTVEIPLNILSDVTGMGILSYQFTLGFDRNIIAPLGFVTAGTMTESWTAPVFNDQASGQVQLGSYNVTELAGSGTLVKLLFLVVGAQGSQTTLQLNNLIFNSGVPQANTESGLFSVERENPDILGHIFYHQSQYPIQYVTISVNNGLFTDLTKSDGSYAFIDLPIDGDYTIKPIMPRFAHLTPDCIHASDASLVAQAAFNLVTLTDFQKRAADVDKDGVIYMYDAAQILYYAVLKAPLNALSYVGEWTFKQDSTVYPNLTTNKTNQNYEAIVLGDVNADLPNPLSLQKRDENPINLPDMIVKNGEEIKIDLKFIGGTSLLTLFFNLTYDPDAFELKAVQKSNQTQQFELFQNSQRGELTLGMLAPHPISINDEIVTLTFAAKAKGAFEFKFDEFMVNTNDPVQYAQQILLGDDAVSAVKSFHLYQNYPNPFNPTTTIHYSLPWEQPEHVEINIYDIRGSLVHTVYLGTQRAGEYDVEWDGRDIRGVDAPSGIYFCSIRSKDKNMKIKMVKTK